MCCHRQAWVVSCSFLAGLFRWICRWRVSCSGIPGRATWRPPWRTTSTVSLSQCGNCRGHGGVRSSAGPVRGSGPWARACGWGNEESGAVIPSFANLVILPKKRNSPKPSAIVQNFPVRKNSPLILILSLRLKCSRLGVRWAVALMARTAL
jgi:hypothetical protein